MTTHLSSAIASPVQPASPPNRVRPLIATDDIDLLDDLLRLAAAARVEADAATSLAALRARWSGAPLVVVGADTLERLGAGHVPRRGGVVIATRDAQDPTIWQRAVELGAEQVVVLPDGESWLVERLSGLADGESPEAPVVAVIGGRGGAGASTMAGAIARCAFRAGSRVSAVDLDPLGPGLDVTLGADIADGLRWGDVARTKGRVPSSLLADGLTTVAGVRVLTWSPGICESLWPGAAGAAIDALRRVSDLVVIDLPRIPSDSVGEAICRAARVLVVVPKDVRSLAAAARVVTSPVLDGAELRLITRGPAPGGLSAADVGEVLGIPVLADMRYEQTLDRNLEIGMAPGDSGRSPLSRASRIVLADLGVTSESVQDRLA